MADPVDGKRLKAVFRTGDDGSKEPVPGMWYDSARSDICSWVTASDGTTRCMPFDGTDGNVSPYFLDAACTQPLAVINGCSTPKYGVLLTFSDCGASQYHFFPFGALVVPTPSSVYAVSASATCAVASPPSETPLYTLGPEIPPSAFVSATLSHD